MNEDSSPELRTPRECGTVDCAGVPTCSFTWPGGKPQQLACTPCANRAVNIASHMGFALQIMPIVDLSRVALAVFEEEARLENLERVALGVSPGAGTIDELREEVAALRTQFGTLHNMNCGRLETIETRLADLERAAGLHVREFHEERTP